MQKQAVVKLHGHKHKHFWYFLDKLIILNFNDANLLIGFKNCLFCINWIIYSAYQKLMKK